MIIEDTNISGLKLITRKKINDERGYFARSYCKQEFFQAGITEEFVQDNICFNEKKGTLRGMHYQKEKQEGKLVTCLRGKILDVCVDLRPNSNTYCQYAAFELSEENEKAVYIPEGFLHGYITLEDNSLLLYKMTEFYIAGNDAGYRYDDPAFNIDWPLNKNQYIISEKDRKLPWFKR